MIVDELDDYCQEQRFQSQTKLQYPALSIGSGKLKYQDLNVSKWNVYLEHCTIVFALCRGLISLQLLMYYYYYILFWFCVFLLPFSLLSLV